MTTSSNRTMEIRIRPDSLQQPETPEGLVGHRFELTGGIETFLGGSAREYTMDTTRLADESAAAAFVEKVTGSRRVEFILHGAAPLEGFVFDRRVVVLDHDGVVLQSFLG